MSTKRTTPVHKTDPYFVGPLTDFMFIGGLSLALLPLIYGISGQPWFSTFLTVVFALQFVINFPHFSATVFRLYRSPENIMAFPVTSFLVPFIILAMTVAAFLSPMLFASAFIMIYFFWSPYHFSGQSLGITMIYARRNDYRIGKRERLFLSGFIFSSFVLGFLWAVSDKWNHLRPETMAEDFFGESFYHLNIPEWTQIPVTLFLVLCAGMFFYLISRQATEKGRHFPHLMVFLPAVTHFVWFIFAARFGIFAFIALVPAFHSLQYLFVAWAVQVKEKHGHDATLDTKTGGKTTGSWYFWNVLGGAVMFFVLPACFANAFNVPFVISFLIVSTGMQLHHFFVDGVIWKLRNPAALSALTTRVSIGKTQNGGSA